MAEKKELTIDKKSIVPDSSVLVEGVLSRLIEAEKNIPSKIIIHEALGAVLEHMVIQNKTLGHLGIEELDRLALLRETKGYELQFLGRRPTLLDTRNSTLREVDSLCRDLAYEEDAVLVTSDISGARIARAKGIHVESVSLDQKRQKIKLESYFDATTMSVHLREGALAFAKKGAPGSWSFVPISKTVLTQELVQEISREIVEDAGVRKDGFLEIEREGSTIIQLGLFRIVITKPPFSDGWEITAVRPVKRMSLDDYQLDEKLMKRITVQAEGILIAGSPGHGKSTFAQGLAEHYANMQKVVKTVEAPRDLVLPETITQYAISHGSSQEIHDILLLSRPDYTIFDEMRNTDDFRLFADLRLSGVGMLGVVHATNPIDAIQRFVGRIELGVIPQVIDTVLFIKDGAVDKVLSLAMTVKVPAGMTEEDLTRPIVVVTDFITGKPEFELYSYGEETVVVPVRQQRKTPSQELAQRQLEQEIKQYAPESKVEIISDHKAAVYVPKKDVRELIGKQGKTIQEIEKKLGIGIDVRELTDREEKQGESIEFSHHITNGHIQITLAGSNHNKAVDILVDGDYLLTAKAGKTGIIKISKKNKIGRILQDAVMAGEKVEVRGK